MLVQQVYWLNVNGVADMNVTSFSGYCKLGMAPCHHATSHCLITRCMHHGDCAVQTLTWLVQIDILPCCLSILYFSKRPSIFGAVCTQLQTADVCCWINIHICLHVTAASQLLLSFLCVHSSRCVVDHLLRHSAFYLIHMFLHVKKFLDCATLSIR